MAKDADEIREDEREEADVDFFTGESAREMDRRWACESAGLEVDEEPAC